MEVSVEIRPTAGALDGADQAGPSASTIKLRLTMTRVSATWGSRLTVGPAGTPDGGSAAASPGGSFYEGPTELLGKLADIATTCTSADHEAGRRDGSRPAGRGVDGT